jgi:hypothetical protein
MEKLDRKTDKAPVGEQSVKMMGEVMRIYRNRRNASLSEMLQRKSNNRFAKDGKQRLGQSICERAKSNAQPRSQDERLANSR